MDKERRSLLGFIGITLVALVWFLLRTGTRPDRIRYPCQKASLDLSVVGIPLMTGLIGLKRLGKRKWRKKIGFLVLGILVATVVLMIASNSFVLRFLYGDPGGVSYPIFTTKFGSRISLKDGIWNGKRFDKSQLKLINMPVLKNHSLMGVTAAIKHYMGVLSTPLCNDGFDQHQGMIKQGLMGRMMAEIIYPDLNVIDANYIGVSSRGPASSYSSAYKADIVLAGTDPIALDYYAGKYILYPLTESERHDPDSQNTSQASGSRGYPSNAFNQYLASSKKELEKKGYRVTMNEKEIQVFVSNGGQ